MSKENFYQEKILEIKDLIKKDLNKAKEILDEELSMPYIPMKFEKDFAELKYQIYNKLSDDFSNNALSANDAEKYLNSNDDIMVAYAVKFYQESNIRKHLEVIKKFMANKNKNKSAKALIFELLIEQKIDYDFKIDNIILNPTKIRSIVEPKIFEKSILLFEKEFNKEPQLVEVAVKEFMQYVLNHFPEIIKLDIYKIANNFINVIKKMIDENLELDKDEEKLFNEIKEEYK